MQGLMQMMQAGGGGMGGMGGGGQNVIQVSEEEKAALDRVCFFFPFVFFFSCQVTPRFCSWRAWDSIAVW